MKANNIPSNHSLDEILLTMTYRVYPTTYTQDHPCVPIRIAPQYPQYNNPRQW